MLYSHNDVSLVHMVSQFIKLVAIMVIFEGIRNIFIAMLRSFKKTKAILINSIFSYWSPGLILAYFSIFLFDFGAYGILFSIILCLTVSATLLVYAVLSHRNFLARINNEYCHTSH